MSELVKNGILVQFFSGVKRGWSEKTSEKWHCVRRKISELIWFFSCDFKSYSECPSKADSKAPHTFAGSVASIYRLKTPENRPEKDLTLLMAQWVDMEASENKNHAFVS